MSSLIKALDSKKVGENGTYEYTWAANSSSIEEKIVQINFQLVRNQHCNSLLIPNLFLLLNHLRDLYDIDDVTIDDTTIDFKKYITIIYKMIGYTRDIIAGKGEYELTFMMIRYFYSFFPELAIEFIPTLVQMENKEHSYGSWKDLKYLCNHCKNSYKTDTRAKYGMYDEIIEKCCNLYNEQLRKDYENMNDSHYNISLVAKWIPRENKKFGWLFYKLAESYFVNYMRHAKSLEQQRLAKRKCYMDYRRIVSTLNKKLDTLQIKQCNNNWSQINFNNVTSISMMIQKDAFLNKKKNGQLKYSYREDRIQCAETFEAYINDKNVEIKGKRVSIVDFTKEAIRLLNTNHNFQNEPQIILLNKQWESNKSQNRKLGKMIAMVDTSGSMEGDPLHAAIAMGVRIAEMSSLGKRVITFNDKPTWVNLENAPNFTTCVEEIHKADWGFNTNFFAAMKLILDAIVETKLLPSEVKDMVLVILSDMQIDQAENTGKRDTMYKTIRKLYQKVGMEHYGEPLTPPHILFWNLRNTNGFPSLSTEPNTSMMSGINPVLMNVFCEEGMKALSEYSPWNVLEKSLNDKRYIVLENIANNFFK
jgi:hypothetical protein|uniref:VWFA domain-containing protein n=1 Tax=viral metagenome TaxID=1070528 RepID=A0A6C0IL32_9ZZZZ